MTDKYDQNDELLKEQESDGRKPDDGKGKHSDSDKSNDYEVVCFGCRSPRSKAGKMFKLPNNICVCDDCMHKTMDAVSQFDYQGVLNDPQFQKDMDSMLGGKGIANIRFVNIPDLQGEGGNPINQKIKKKKKGETSQPILNIKDIPAPHKIKASLDENVVGQELAK